MAATGEGDGKGAVKPPNWISLELLAVKMAAHEASTGAWNHWPQFSQREDCGLLSPAVEASMFRQWAFTWPKVLWSARGRNVILTLEDLCTMDELAA